MRKFIYIIPLLIFGCSQKQEKSFNDYFNISPTSIQNILIDHIKLDTLKLDNINSSLSGQLQINDSLLYYIDYRFCWVFIFDKDGNLIEKKLGQGRGPKEVPAKSIDAFSFLPGGYKMVFGSTSDYYLIDEDWSLLSQKIIPLDYNNTSRENPIDPASYTFDYENLNIQNDSKGCIYLPIYGETKLFNPFSSKYYTEGRILLKLDFNENKIKGILGRRSPQYLDYKFLGHHAFFHFNVDKMDNFYITHEIDSLIYVYDTNFNPIKAFGIPGKNMNTDYQALPAFDISKFRDLYFNDKPKRGYYKWIKKINEKNILFRSYNKNSETPFDGLQIYQNDTLIADVNVPKNFKVIGYIDPYYYSNEIINEMEETIKVYRFLLDL